MASSTFGFCLPPSAPSPSQRHPLQSSHPVRRKCNRRTPAATLRKALLLATKNPSGDHGASPRYQSSIRYPDLNVYTLTWSPTTGNPNAGLLISPGLVWHSGWFAEIGAALAAAGCETVAMDGIGMGRADSLRGLRGLITSIDDHVQELAAELKRMEANLPKGTPLFVLGESSGGLTATLLALNEEIAQRVCGYVLCAPALAVKKELLPPPPVQSLVKVVGRFLPALPTPGEQISGETWDMAFGDRRYAEISKKDPLVGYGVPMRMGSAASFLGGMQTVEKALQEGELKMPNLLVLHNREDARTDFTNSENLVDRVVCQGDCSLVQPGGTGHQLFQDKSEITEDVIQRIVKFVSEIAKKHSSGAGTNT